MCCELIACFACVYIILCFIMENVWLTLHFRNIPLTLTMDGEVAKDIYVITFIFNFENL